MAIKIVHDFEIGQGLEQTEGMLVVKAGRNITVDQSGVHADIDVGVTDVTGTATGISVTKGTTTTDIPFPAQTTPVTNTALTIAGTSISVVDSQGNQVEGALPNAFTSFTKTDNTVTFTKVDGTTENLELPAIPVDIHFDNAEFTDEGKLKVTLSNGDTKETDFNAEIVVKAVEGATETQKQRIAAALKDELLKLIKGEEVQDLNGESKGFLLAK